MKICPNCSSQFDDDKKFCGVCGTQLEDVVEDKDDSPIIAPIPVPIPVKTQSSSAPETVQTPKPHVGDVIADSNTRPVDVNKGTIKPPSINTPTSEVADPNARPVDVNKGKIKPPAPETTKKVSKIVKKNILKPKKRMGKGLLISLISSSAVITATVVIGIMTNWFGLASPIPKIIKAAANTFNADSFTVKVTEKYSYKYEDEEHTDSEDYEIKVVISDNKEITALLDYYDGKIVYQNDEYYQISDDEDYADIDTLEIEDEIFRIRDKINSDNEIDYKGIIKEYDFDNLINADEAETFVKEATKKYFNNRKWMKNTLGYKKQNGEMTFTPDMAELLEDFAELIDDTDIIKHNDDKDAIVESLGYEAESYEDFDSNFEISVTLDKNYLKTVEFKTSSDYGYNVVTFEFYDINNTDIKNSEIDRIKNRTKEIIEEKACVECGYMIAHEKINGQNYCSECYFDFYYDYDYDYEDDYESDGYWEMDEYDDFGDCSVCGEFDCVKYYDDDDYRCYECYYTHN